MSGNSPRFRHFWVMARKCRRVVDPDQSEVGPETRHKFSVERRHGAIIDHQDFVVFGGDIPLICRRQRMERPVDFAWDIIRDDNDGDRNMGHAALPYLTPELAVRKPNMKI